MHVFACVLSIETDNLNLNSYKNPSETVEGRTNRKEKQEKCETFLPPY